MHYFKFINKQSLLLINSNFDFSTQIKSILKKKNNNMVFFSSIHKIYLTNFLYDVSEDGEDTELNNYSAWFFDRNNN